MGYKIMYKDKYSKGGRFEKWNNTIYKTKSSAEKRISADKANKKYGSFKGAKFEIRKVSGKTSRTKNDVFGGVFG